MKEPVNGSYRYQVGGALGKDVSSYVKRAADRQFYEALQEQEFCYVLNSRQMGKSSLMVRTLAQLQSEGWAGIVLDFSAKDSQGEQPERWYNGIINQLNRHFSLLDNARSWLKERDFLSPVERLEEFIETVLLPGINERIVIFIDEIDSTLNLPFTDDFFALIRACYNKRAENPDYKRLTFALLGVAAPAELIGDQKRTPFNIGQAIDLKGFQLGEAQPLVEGLVGKADNPQAVLPEILKWTGGQPFLTQRLCQLVVDVAFIPPGQEASSIEQLARTRLIENWESQDEQEHLKTIRNRLLSNEQKAGYLLELYRQIRQAGKLKFQNTSEERDLQLSGLVVKRDDYLTVYNPIYEQVFNEQWIDGELGKLRPYAENFRAWVDSGGKDESRLLRGQFLQDAEQWSSDKNLSFQDKEFLAASQGKEIKEKNVAADKEAELERERKDKEAAEKANKRLWRQTLIGTVFLVAALIGAGFFAWEAKNQNEILTAVRSLSQIAGELRKKESANASHPALNPSDEALRKAGLSTLIENEELKEVWLFAATAEAYQSLGDPGRKKAQDTVKKSLNSLKNSKAQLEQRNFHQVSAFAYLMFGKLNNDNERDYREAYNALKASKLDLNNPNTESGFLTEKDVASIHVELIESLKDDKNFKIQVEKSLIKSLPSIREINDLLAKQKWQEADYKTLTRISSSSISCPILKAIDLFWLDNSKGRFGFSVQKQIYLEMGNKLNIYGKSNSEKNVSDAEEENFKRFATRVGWKDSSWEKLNASIDAEQFPRGVFPVMSALRDEQEYILSSDGGMFGETGWLLRDDSRKESNWASGSRRRAAIYLNRNISLTATCKL